MYTFTKKLECLAWDKFRNLEQLSFGDVYSLGISIGTCWTATSSFDTSRLTSTLLNSFPKLGWPSNPLPIDVHKYQLSILGERVRTKCVYGEALGICDSPTSLPT